MSTSRRRLAMINSDGKSAPPGAAPDGVEIVLHDLRMRVLARTPYDHLFTELATVEAAEAALAAGCEGIFIDTFGDYGIDRIRAVTDVPVVGAGEASLEAAARVGRYSIVTVWPASMAYLYDARVRACAGGEACVGVHFVSPEDELERVGTRDGVQARMLRGELELVEHLVAACHAAVERDDAEAVLLGCTCMSPVAAAVAAGCDVPVLDPSIIGLRAAVAAMGLPTGRPPAPGSRRLGLATELVDAYTAARPLGDASPDDCEVCSITATRQSAGVEAAT